jgi:leukotriene-A4 hydrolase
MHGRHRSSAFSAPLSSGALSASLLALLHASVGCSSDDAAVREDPAPSVASAPAAAATRATDTRPDPHSFARPDQVAVRHIALDLSVDFNTSVLSGTATLDLFRPEGVTEVDRVILDSRGLGIDDVTDAGGGPLDYAFGDDDPLLGRALIIHIDDEVEQVIVRYRTAPDAAALQWLDRSLTEGKVHPFLFTQGQAILTRTWIPLQDTPSVRVTYSARVSVPAPLVAAMSAEQLTPLDDAKGQGGSRRTFAFKMDEPIPPYLIALAVGDLGFKALGPRTGVWAEPASLERAAAEFSDVEAMMTTVEGLYGPYRWGRYDILVLPPSFPFGGMENPRLTFLSPTVIAGDKSLVSVVAHELAHSWSGNLVTNATWGDFWLNEGFTTYIENRILEVVYGKDRAKLVEAMGRRDLIEEMDELGHDAEATKLKCDLIGLDPDEAISSTPYDKGMAFLRLLENTFGREAFDAFLRRYFDDNAFKTMTTEVFAERLKTELFAPSAGGGEASVDAVQLDTWLYAPGMPANVPAVDSARLAAIEAAAGKVAGGAALADVEDTSWGALEWVLFMRALPRASSEALIAALDARLSASTTGNSEIRFEWLKLVIANRYQPGVPALRSFVTTQGRRRLVEPMYIGLMKSDWGRPIAAEVYADARASYHPLTRVTIDAIVQPTTGGASSAAGD